MVTVTAVRPPARFGNLELDTEQHVTSFGEKNQMETGWINGGFFVLNRNVLDFIDGDLTSFEFDSIIGESYILNEFLILNDTQNWRQSDIYTNL